MGNTSADRRPRPSSLPHLWQCARFVSRPDNREKKDSIDEAADEGTMLHAKMEALADVPLAGWDAAIEKDPDLSPHQVTLVKEAADQVRDLFAMGLKPVTKKSLGLTEALGADGFRHTLPQAASDCDMRVFAEVGVDPVVCKPGTADLAAVFGNRAVLVDYKTVYVVRDHDLQMKAYVVGLFEALPAVNFVEVRIVTPRLRDAHEPVTYIRARDFEDLRSELSELVERALDEFTPGCPGEACAFCKGNGRCPYQWSSLRDVPVEEAALSVPDAWKPLLAVATPDLRGRRRRLVKWLEAFVDAAKEDDKAWARDNPDAALPGFVKSVSIGRPSLDRDRLPEVNRALMSAFGIGEKAYIEYVIPDKERLAEYVGLMHGVSAEQAKRDIATALAPYVKRGEDIVSFRAVKPKKPTVERVTG